jgi:hypothetical protein
MQLQEGTYTATGKALSITETEKGAIMLNFTFALDDGTVIPARQCLVQKDGTISEITLRMLRECFGFTGPDPFELADNPELLAKPVELVVAIEEYEGKQRSVVKYINPPGGGTGTGKPVDRNQFKQRFGTKLRAMTGGSPAATPKPAAPKPPTPPAAPAATKTTAPKKPTAGPSTMEEAWGVFCNENTGIDEQELYRRWDVLLTKIKPNHGNNLTPEEWGQAKAMAEDNVTY